MGGVVDKVGGFLGLSGEEMHGSQAGAIPKPAFGISGGIFGGGSYDPVTGKVVQRGTEATNIMGRQMLGQAGGLFGTTMQAGAQAQGLGREALGALGSFDPFQAAEEQFGRLDAMLEPGRAEARAGTAASLLQGGRLGSTGGARVTGQVEGEIERQRQQLLSDQFMQAQQVQSGMVDRATALGGLGLQQQMGRQQLATGMLGGAMSIDAQQQAALGLGSQISSPAGVAQAQPGIIQSGIGGLMTGIGSKI